MADRKVDPKKAAYRKRMLELLEEYEKVLVVKADNVSSNQFHQLRKTLRDRAVILMGKNTQMRRAVEIAAKKNPKLKAMIPLLKLNVGLVFTDEDLSDIRAVLLANVVGAPAKVGAIAPAEVTVPAGNTGLEPGMTAFFQALNIPTKITKGTVEIQQDVVLLQPGQRVGQSEATLLAKLNIKPFTYGLKCETIYDKGSVYNANLLDLTDSDVDELVHNCLTNVGAVGTYAKYPTIVTAPASVAAGYSRILAVALATEYSFPLADKVKEILANPGAFAAAAPAAAAAAPAASSSGKAAAPAKAPEPEPEPEDEDMGFSLFD